MRIYINNKNLAPFIVRYCYNGINDSFIIFFIQQLNVSTFLSFCAIDVKHISLRNPKNEQSTIVQGCAQFRVESTLAHSTQFSFELTFELIFECATLWMPIHWAEWGFIGLVRTIPFNSHSRIDSLLSKSSHGWECECARMAFELDTTLANEELETLSQKYLTLQEISTMSMVRYQSQ